MISHKELIKCCPRCKKDWAPLSSPYSGAYVCFECTMTYLPQVDLSRFHNEYTIVHWSIDGEEKSWIYEIKANNMHVIPIFLPFYFTDDELKFYMTFS